MFAVDYMVHIRRHSIISALHGVSGGLYPDHIFLSLSGEEITVWVLVLITCGLQSKKKLHLGFWEKELTHPLCAIYDVKQLRTLYITE